MHRHLQKSTDNVKNIRCSNNISIQRKNDALNLRVRAGKKAAVVFSVCRRQTARFVTGTKIDVQLIDLLLLLLAFLPKRRTAVDRVSLTVSNQLEIEFKLPEPLLETDFFTLSLASNWYGLSCQGGKLERSSAQGFVPLALMNMSASETRYANRVLKRQT